MTQSCWMRHAVYDQGNWSCSTLFETRCCSKFVPQYIPERWFLCSSVNPGCLVNWRTADNPALDLVDRGVCVADAAVLQHVEICTQLLKQAQLKADEREVLYQKLRRRIQQYTILYRITALYDMRKRGDHGSLCTVQYLCAHLNCGVSCEIRRSMMSRKKKGLL